MPMIQKVNNRPTYFENLTDIAQVSPSVYLAKREGTTYIITGDQYGWCIDAPGAEPIEGCRSLLGALYTVDTGRLA